jgi:hypothetical protein
MRAVVAGQRWWQPHRPWSGNPSVQFTNNGRFPVRQHGPRRLWNKLETAHTWWIEHDRPGRTRYGLTITPDTQTVWLDQPNNTVTALPECLLPTNA